VPPAIIPIEKRYVRDMDTTKLNVRILENPMTVANGIMANAGLQSIKMSV